jgi:threonine synthase
VVGTNSNDILYRYLESGTMEITGVAPTLSPSMDIQVSSNFERLLFDMLDRDGALVAETMKGFRATGSFTVGDNQLGRARALFEAHRIDDTQTQGVIRAVHGETGEILDPHTAVGVGAARALELDPDIAVIALACAHPAKFPDAVEQATGIRPALPPRLADLFEREERVAVLPNELAAVQAYVSEKTGQKEAV